MFNSVISLNDTNEDNKTENFTNENKKQNCFSGTIGSDIQDLYKSDNNKNIIEDIEQVKINKMQLDESPNREELEKSENFDKISDNLDDFNDIDISKKSEKSDIQEIKKVNNVSDLHKTRSNYAKSKPSTDTNIIMQEAKENIEDITDIKL